MAQPVGVISDEGTVWNWEVTQGALVQLRIPILDQHDVPFTVNGWSVDAAIKARPGGRLLHTWSAGDVEVSGTSVTLTVLPATSLAWPFAQAWYRVKIAHPSDATQIHRVLRGALIVAPD